MPSTIIPPGYAQVFLRWSAAGDNEEMLSSCGVRLAAGQTDPVVVAGNFITDFLSAWPLSALSESYTLVGARAYIGSDGDYPVGEYLLNDPGESESAFLPSNCALLIQKRTALGGRRNRGRFYLPAGYLSEQTVDGNGRISSGAITTFQGRNDTWLAAIEANETAYDAAVILHSSAPSTPTIITGFIQPQLIATQRTRMRP